MTHRRGARRCRTSRPWRRPRPPTTRPARRRRRPARSRTWAACSPARSRRLPPAAASAAAIDAAAAGALALGEPQQGQARLRVAPVLVRVRVGRLRAGEITAQPTHLAHLVVGVGHGEHVDADHVLAGAERLRLGLLPRAAHLQHLRVVHPADARVERGQRQRVAPASGRLGPLGGPAQVAQLVARVHQAAVDRARPEQGELVGQRGHHGLVQQREPLGHPGLLDADAPLEVDAQGGERRVVETPAEVLHAARPGERHRPGRRRPCGRRCCR